ncbi:unnamed protein product [Cochlearia groenlandica]
MIFNNEIGFRFSSVSSSSANIKGKFFSSLYLPSINQSPATAASATAASATAASPTAAVTVTAATAASRTAATAAVVAITANPRLLSLKASKATLQCSHALFSYLHYSSLQMLVPLRIIHRDVSRPCATVAVYNDVGLPPSPSGLSKRSTYLHWYPMKLKPPHTQKQRTCAVALVS